MSSSRSEHYYHEMQQARAEKNELKDTLKDKDKTLEEYQRLLDAINMRIITLDPSRKDAYYKALVHIRKDIQDVYSP